MEMVKSCKTCNMSLYIGSPDDPDRQHGCDVVTSGRIKNESECKDFGFKYFFPKEHED
jgi:hypothetical protein